MIDGLAALESFKFDSSIAKRLTGGDINQVYRINDSVIKVNSAANFPKMLELEADGLSKLGKHIRTPQVLNSGTNEDYQFLEISFISSGTKTAQFWTKFGADLANLHGEKSDSFGLEYDNYIGSLKQSNDQHANWDDFLIQERLEPMVVMAVNNGDVNYVEAKVFGGFYAKINELFPVEKPSLIHGDLWGGNYICSDDQEGVLIDPAVYYGHREMDIGMMHLFGGFEARMFESYNDHFPLEKGWRDRIKYNQLYPLMVHVNLFGRSYWSQVYNIVKEFA